MNINHTLQDVIHSKKINDDEYDKDLTTLNKFNAGENVNELCGNKIIYHHQFENLIKTPALHHKSFHQFMTCDDLRQHLINETNTRCVPYGIKITPSTVFRVHRANKSCVSIFRPSTATYIYKRYRAENVLDFTAGWGGRMLGAYALGISYTGIDTNINMKPEYDSMIARLNNNNLKILWDNCSNVDLSQFDFDLVLTSPPYINIETYENMTLFNNKDEYYKDF